MTRVTGIIFIKRMRRSNTAYAYAEELHKAVYRTVAERKQKIKSLAKRFEVDNRFIVLSVMPIIEITK